MSISRFTGLNITDPRGFIMTIHFILLGAILVLAEFKINYVIRNFGLVKSIFGRGLYTLFLGTIMLTTSDMFQLVVAIILICVGFLYFLMSCKEQNYDAVDNPSATGATDNLDKNYKKALSLNSNAPSIK